MSRIRTTSREMEALLPLGSEVKYSAHGLALLSPRDPDRIGTVVSKNAGVVAIGLGKLGDLLELTRTAPPIEPTTHDLCGQDCLNKHAAKLLHAGPAADPEAAHG